MNWIALTSIKQLNELKSESKKHTVLIFKHSTRCSISSIVLDRFEKMYTPNPNSKLYYLDLLKYREVSNQIAKDFKVVHQSPQLLIIKDEKVIKHASHNAILEVDLSNC